jgi:hypothetical protein
MLIVPLDAPHEAPPMGFWETTLTNVLGGIGTAIVLLLGYMVVQWFLAATDLIISYNWKFGIADGAFWAAPNFDIRNRSRSKAYRLANIGYTINGKVFAFDNKSLWGKVVEPGSINNQFEVDPVKGVSSLSELQTLEVTVRLQTGRSFWLRGQGPGQEGRSRLRRWAFRLRNRLEKMMVPME